MADLFHVIDGAQAVLHVRPGIFRQASLYHRKGILYARNCAPENIEMGPDGQSLTAHGQCWMVEG